MDQTNEQLIFDLLACVSDYERANVYWKNGMDDKAKECWRLEWAELNLPNLQGLSAEECESECEKRWQQASVGSDSQRATELMQPREFSFAVFALSVMLQGLQGFEAALVQVDQQFGGLVNAGKYGNNSALNQSAPVLMMNDNTMNMVKPTRNVVAQLQPKKPYYQQARDKRKSRWN